MRVRPLPVKAVLASSALVAASVVAGTAGSQAATPTRAPGAVRVTFNHLVGGFSSPVYVTAARDGSRRLFVVQQGGIVRVVKSGAVQPRAYLNITSEVLSGGEEGLLSIAFHPHFAKHPFVFVAYTRSDKALQVSRFRAGSSSARSIAPSTEVRLFAVPHPSETNHNGGQLMFGRGGLMYVTTGDGGGGNDPVRNAERLASLSGEILRLGVDPPGGGRDHRPPARHPLPRPREGRKPAVVHPGGRTP